MLVSCEMNPTISKQIGHDLAAMLQGESAHDAEAM